VIPALKEAVVLIQSDTTVGLLSQSGPQLNRLKGRLETQPLIETVASLAVLKKRLRVPVAVRSRIRRTARTTIAYPQGQAIRVVSGRHARQLQALGWCYSTSANPTGRGFSEPWAKEQANLWCLRPEGFSAQRASKIFRLSRNGRLIKLR
jgi:tRNA A37 threonylcarbamoyladenosine synthetase subunit TsaC/SUA5/YrdC